MHSLAKRDRTCTYILAKRVLTGSLLTVLGIVFGASYGSTLAHANEAFHYPELEVAPLASERLQWEAQFNPGFSTYLPYWISGVTHLAGALTYTSRDSITLKDDGSEQKTPVGSALVPYATAATVLGLGVYFQVVWKPYADASARIQSLPAKTDREKIIRERLAEEALNAAANLESVMAWVATATSVGSGLYLALTGTPTAVNRTTAALMIVTAPLPLIFPSRRIRASTQQSEYKRKIYGPLSQLQLAPLITPQSPSTSASLGIQLSGSF
jgi:hypothetical protein